MPVRSTREAFSFNPDGSVQELWAVPADRTFILKDLRSQVAGTGVLALFLRTGADTGQVVILNVDSAVAGGTAETEPGREINMREGDRLLAFGDAALTSAGVWMSGALLDGDPS